MVWFGGKRLVVVYSTEVPLTTEPGEGALMQEGSITQSYLLYEDVGCVSECESESRFGNQCYLVGR